MGDRPKRGGNNKEKLKPGTSVTVKADAFDNFKVPANERWSSQFPSGGNEELAGTVLSHLSENPVIVFDYDGKSSSVLITKVTVVCEPIVSDLQNVDETVPSPFEFDSQQKLLKVVNSKRKRQGRQQNKGATIITGTGIQTGTPAPNDPPPPQSASECLAPEVNSKRKRQQKKETTAITVTGQTGTSGTPASNDPPPPQSTADVSVPEVKRTRVKKLPLYKRPVNSLQAAEEEDNYDRNLQLPDPPIELSAMFKVSDKNYRTLKYSTSTNNKVRRSGRDILVGEPGVVEEAKGLTTAVEAFDYFFPVALQEKIISFTNKRIATSLISNEVSREEEDDDEFGDEGPGQESEDASGIGVWVASVEEELDGIVLDDGLEQADDHLDSENQHFEREITDLEVEDDYILTEEDKRLENGAPKYKQFLSLEEFRAFLGLWYMRGLYSQASTKLSNLYQADHLPVFSAVMPRKRFKWILRHISFDGCLDSNERATRWQHDRLAAVRYLFETVNKKWSKAIVPSEYITIDETLYNLYTQVAFKVYNKSKPQKYGVLFKSINAVEFPYTFVSHCYAGSPEGTPNQFYVKGTDEYTKYLIKRMAEEVPLTGRNLTMDRLYTSVPILEWLWESQHMTGLGTFQSNRRGYPVPLKTPGANKTSEVYYQVDGPLVLVRYSTVTKSSGAVSVVIMTTRKPLLGVTNDEQRKPAMFKLYDFTKTGTDQMDSRFSTGKYCSKPKTRRWTIAFFSYVLDTTRVNAQTVCALNTGKNAREIDSFHFGKNFAMDLIKPFIEKRDISRMNNTILMKMFALTQNRRYLRAMLRLHEPPNLSHSLAFHGQSAQPLKRCDECISSLEMNMDTGKARNKAIGNLTKVASICEQCGNVRCKKHLLKICNSCYAQKCATDQSL